MNYHNGYPFTTKDQDNDKALYNCAERFGGAWWFGSCHYASLNSDYYPQEEVPFGKGI